MTKKKVGSFMGHDVFVSDDVPPGEIRLEPAIDANAPPVVQPPQYQYPYHQGASFPGAFTQRPTPLGFAATLP